MDVLALVDADDLVHPDDDLRHGSWFSAGNVRSPSATGSEISLQTIRLRLYQEALDRIKPSQGGSTLRSPSSGGPRPSPWPAASPTFPEDALV